ncbi:MAG: hypothetical protein KCHDKBKB_02249 [Elusimicrobia bacterium]|nr:hypothetical protein [Elusimicrobiota bacterium]
MDKTRVCLNPDELTPEERMNRIVQLLTEAVLRLIHEGKVATEKIDEGKSDMLVPFNFPRRCGPVPFGQMAGGWSRTPDEKEAKWIERIKELKKQGLSTEKIAQTLNQEDKETRRSGRWTRTAVWRILKRFDK